MHVLSLLLGLLLGLGFSFEGFLFLEFTHLTATMYFWEVVLNTVSEFAEFAREADEGHLGLAFGVTELTEVVQQIHGFNDIG